MCIYTHTKWASYSIHQANPLEGFGWPQSIGEDFCPRYQAVGLNLEPHVCWRPAPLLYNHVCARLLNLLFKEIVQKDFRNKEDGRLIKADMYTS